MASHAFIPTRRGFLGVFAAASAAAAVSVSMALPAAEDMDWRSKPVERWTQADFVAEAEFELAGHAKKAREVFRVGMSHHEEELYNAHRSLESWWKLELMDRQGRFA